MPWTTDVQTCLGLYNRDITEDEFAFALPLDKVTLISFYVSCHSVPGLSAISGYPPRDHCFICYHTAESTVLFFLLQIAQCFINYLLLTAHCFIKYLLLIAHYFICYLLQITHYFICYLLPDSTLLHLLSIADNTLLHLLSSAYSTLLHQLYTANSNSTLLHHLLLITHYFINCLLWIHYIETHYSEQDTSSLTETIHIYYLNYK